ncbi:MAG: hypothetical protein M3075_11620 [Candidatus Dormibacteraeota bacterium]|nr:hypothetical protein [Candidatus Dormibacteraeota bacterium]
MSEPRAVHQSPEWARTHSHVIGPTGGGKSSLLVSMALDDLRQGVGIAPWTDPKDGQAADALLARIPDEYADRTVLFDPNRLDYAVGLNVLECDTPERRDVAVDQIVAVFQQLFHDVWGRRQAELLYMGLTTLMHHRETTLCDLPRLFTDAESRQHWVRPLEDPELQGWWAAYAKQPPGDAAPLLGRLQSLLLRPRVRQVLGQCKSTVDLADILDNGGIVIARLPLELAMTSQLLGSFLFLRCWQVIQGRQRLPESLRHDAAAYLDEGELFMHIRGSVAGVFDQSRSARWGIVFAHQRLGQLPKDMADALDTNALTKVVFRPTTIDNAKAVAGLVYPLMAEDLLRLEHRQVAVRLPLGRPFVGRTPELPPALRDPRELADHALKRWGKSQQNIDDELRSGRRRRSDPVPW